MEVGYAVTHRAGLVCGTLTEERIIFDRRDQILIIGEERFRSSQVREIRGGGFLWEIVSHMSLLSYEKCDLFADVVDEPDALVKVESC